MGLQKVEGLVMLIAGLSDMVSIFKLLIIIIIIIIIMIIYIYLIFFFLSQF